MQQNDRTDVLLIISSNCFKLAIRKHIFVIDKAFVFSLVNGVLFQNLNISP